jgi:hypothetical protein
MVAYLKYPTLRSLFMKYTFVALLLSILVSSLSVNLLYIDILNEINQSHSVNEHKMSIIMEKVDELTYKTE